MARYANRQMRPSSNLGVCGFESLPCYSLAKRPGIIAFGRAVGRQGVCKTAALRGNVGSIPTRGTGRLMIFDLRLKIENCRIYAFQSQIFNQKSTIPHGSFFQRPGCQVVNLTTRVQLPYEPPVDVDG